ncbi:glycosyltransferase family 4 protein [Paracrocinitomix mangrovi]|uniref:glycosyltransferase family 4 protein n=1 Tax=Paracrocinitomix mangrovi TaxID=2862509 RepID=UPI001C8E4DB5|nr:glycosyltransferase family 4 protein [Paracrocinitomix mangrovi]UKN01233.1 glycosyltransferase family 4 protein [Paracrocinitomix mangrovi]
MKVLTVQNIEGVAGSEKYFLALLPALIKKGVDCAVYCVYKEKNIAGAEQFFKLLEENNIPYFKLKVKSYGSIKIPRSINKLYKSKNYDIIHTHLIYADFWGAIVKQYLNKKAVVISTKHGYHEDTYVKFCNQAEKLPINLYYRLFKYTHKKLDRSYACSYGLVDFYERGKLISKGSMDVIQHGFDYPEIPSFDQSNYRFSKNQIIIVGRLIERKGHHFALEIMPEIIEAIPDVQLIILGDGELRQNLEGQTNQLGISEHVQFLGFKSEVEKYLSASDVALFPSYSEGLPLVIFEAFNAKVPVVTFDAIGCNELVKHEQTGLLASAFSKEELKEYVLRIFNNKEEASTFVENAYEMLKQHFCLDRMVKDTIEFYQTRLA